MSVDERCVIVFVLVIVGAVLELAERAARVVMRHVVVVVGMDRGRVLVLVLDVAYDTLCGARLQDAPPVWRGLTAALVDRRRAATWRSSSPRRGTAGACQTLGRLASPYRPRAGLMAPARRKSVNAVALANQAARALPVRARTAPAGGASEARAADP